MGVMDIFNKVAIFSKYAVRHTLEAIDENNALFRPRVTSVAISDVSERSHGCSLTLLQDEGAKEEFGIVERKLGRMLAPACEMENIEQCDICASTLRPMVEIAGTCAGKKDKLVLGWCPACDHVQYARRPPVEWFKDWYAHSFDSADVLQTNLETRPFTWRYYNRLNKYLPEKKCQILDLGAGYAEKTRAFKECGHELICVEPSEARAQYLRSIGCKVICGALGEATVDAFVEENGPYDLVFTYHVVEHVAGGLGVYKKLVDSVAEEGLFYIAVPELRMEGAMNHVYMLEHLHSFSRNSGVRFLNRLGFEKVVAAKDPFQYISNYCQYFIGRKKSEVALSASHSNGEGYPQWLVSQFSLGRLAGKKGQVGFQTFSHAGLNYQFDCAPLASLCRDDGEPLLKIDHGELPPFYAS